MAAIFEVERDEREALVAGVGVRNRTADGHRQADVDVVSREGVALLVFQVADSDSHIFECNQSVQGDGERLVLTLGRKGLEFDRPLEFSGDRVVIGGGVSLARISVNEWERSRLAEIADAQVSGVESLDVHIIEKPVHAAVVACRIMGFAG
jgi:hypothetical protein